MPTVSGTVTDRSGNVAVWSASFNVTTPTTPRVLWGACPHNDGSITTVGTKFGTKAAVRGFQGGGLNVRTRPANAAIVHYSWKPAIGASFSRSVIVANFAHYRPGDVVEVHHESNNDADATTKAGEKSRFHAAIVAARDAGDIPMVRTCNTQTGWAFDNRSTQVPVYADADLVGCDMDGIQSTDGQPSDSHRGLYYDFYNHEYAECVAWMQARGYAGWCIPELGTTRHSTDPNSVWRVESMQIQADKINNAPIKPVYAAWFDFSNLPSTSAHVECYEKANEIAFIQSLVASN